MSERQLREGAVTKGLDGSWVCIHCLAWSDDPDWLEHEDDCPVRADPDIVALLQWLIDQILLPNTAAKEAWTFGFVAERIRREFGVDLTHEPPGWEWTGDK